VSAVLRQEAEEEAKVLRGRGIRSAIAHHCVAIGLWPGMTVLGRRVSDACIVKVCVWAAAWGMCGALVHFGRRVVEACRR
jgi:hypothetical protein